MLTLCANHQQQSKQNSLTWASVLESSWFSRGLHSQGCGASYTEKTLSWKPTVQSWHLHLQSTLPFLSLSLMSLKSSSPASVYGLRPQFSLRYMEKTSLNLPSAHFFLCIEALPYRVKGKVTWLMPANVLWAIWTLLCTEVVLTVRRKPTDQREATWIAAGRTSPRSTDLCWLNSCDWRAICCHTASNISWPTQQAWWPSQVYHNYI